MVMAKPAGFKLVFVRGDTWHVTVNVTGQRVTADRVVSAALAWEDAGVVHAYPCQIEAIQAGVGLSVVVPSSDTHDIVMPDDGTSVTLRADVQLVLADGVLTPLLGTITVYADVNRSDQDA